MDTHAKVLGVLNIVYGAVGLLAALFFLLVFGGVAGLVAAEGNADVAVPIIGLTGGLLVALIVITSLPAVIIGYGLYQRRSWSRVWGIALSIVSLLFVPLGTALGVYGLWVLFSKEGQQLFEPAQARP
jgi:hypothetical protein